MAIWAPATPREVGKLARRLRQVSVPVKYPKNTNSIIKSNSYEIFQKPTLVAIWTIFLYLFVTATNPAIQVFPLQKTLAGGAIVERADLLKAAVQRTALIIIDDEPEKSGLLDNLINLHSP